ncbi:hypothetical protein MUP77_24440 [Candidatus Bathyarchaeota archaeon]|nr:hypothetical protein [Candidatus Bathyarchaeota archaeon]
MTKALLYWHGPTNLTDPDANAAVTFAGEEITGTNIGLSDDNCWPFANSHAYRADVTSLVTEDGDYALGNLIKQNVEINGASLIVFFDDGNAANNRDVVLFDGNDSNIPNIYDADGWNVTLSGINYASGTASIDLHVGDGQTYTDDALILNGNTLVAAGAIFQGVSVPNGASAAQTNGGLWDIKSYNVTADLTPGPNTLTLTTGVNSDCLSLVVAAVNLPAGAAPEQPTATPGPDRVHKRATRTPTPTVTATPLPPTATPLPTLAPHPPASLPVIGAVPQLIAPPTGEGAETGAGLPWTIIGLAIAGAIGVVAGLGGYWLWSGKTGNR